MFKALIHAIATALVFVTAVNTPIRAETARLEGKAAFGDWQRDKPGTIRLIRPEDMPKPGATASAAKVARVVPKPRGAVPQIPTGFKIELFAEGLSGPRIVRVAPNGDMFVAETGANRVLVFSASDRTSGTKTAQIYATGLNHPFGVAFFPSGDDPQWLYVANTDSVVRFAYRSGDLKASSPRETVVANLPHGSGHSSRDIAFAPGNDRMFVSVGSDSNDGEGMGNPPGGLKAWSSRHTLGAGWGNENDRAAVLAFDPDGKNQKT